MLIGVFLAAVLTMNWLEPAVVGFLLAAALLVVIGLLDDKYDIDWRWRILGQIAAALILIHVGGVRVHYLGQLFGYDNIFLGSLSVPFTVVATVGIINAVNMVDGADGLAGSLVLAALAMLAAAALYSGNHAVFTRSLLVIGAVAGFLLVNIRHPWQRSAKSFMGNAGSAFLGLTIAWIAFQLTQNPAHPVTPVLALWLVPIPIIDCLVLIMRRLTMRRSPFHADRNHIHHLMLDAGFTPTRAAIALTAFSFLCGLSAAVVLRTDVPHDYLFGGFLVLCAAWFGVTAKRSRALAFFGSTATEKFRREAAAGCAINAAVEKSQNS